MLGGDGSLWDIKFMDGPAVLPHLVTVDLDMETVLLTADKTKPKMHRDVVVLRLVVPNGVPTEGILFSELRPAHAPLMLCLIFPSSMVISSVTLMILSFRCLSFLWSSKYTMWSALVVAMEGWRKMF